MAVVLVTGCSSGIGLATALHFARLGHDVQAGVRDPDTAAELGAAVAAENLAVHVVALDVDATASVTRAVDDVLRRAGRIDVARVGGDVQVDAGEPQFLHRARELRRVTDPLQVPRAGVEVEARSGGGRRGALCQSAADRGGRQDGGAGLQEVTSVDHLG